MTDLKAVCEIMARLADEYHVRIMIEPLPFGASFRIEFRSGRVVAVACSYEEMESAVAFLELIKIRLEAYLLSHKG